MTMGVMPSTGSDASGGSDGATPVDGGRTVPDRGAARLLVEQAPTVGSGHDGARGDTATEHQEAASVPVGHLGARCSGGPAADARSRAGIRHAGAVRSSKARRTASPAPTATITVTMASTCDGERLAQRGHEGHGARDHEADDARPATCGGPRRPAAPR